VSSTKLLIVDDELILRESLAGWLQRDGHAVDTASSGEEALEKLIDKIDRSTLYSKIKRYNLRKTA